MRASLALFPRIAAGLFSRVVSDRVAPGFLVLAALTLACGHPAAPPENDQSQERAQPSTSKKQDPTWDNIRRIIAQKLSVPEDKVVPSARFDDDLNAAEPDMEDMVEGFDAAFGTESDTDDAGLLVTVQDAIDYIDSPSTFREAHAGRDTYSDVQDPYPTDVKYSKYHEWVKVEGGEASIGVTWALDHRYVLGALHLPEVGHQLTAGAPYAIIDAGMAGIPLNAPVSGTVIEVNKQLASSGRRVHKNPYAAWIIKVKLADPKEIDALISAADYREFVDAGN